MSERVKRLPPYLFGKINDLKYRKRRAGIDIIDLGMGNPTDIPEQTVIDKMVEAVKDERNHRYSVSNGLFNLRREAALRYERRHGVNLDPETEVLAGLGSKEVFSHMCLALLGPGDTAIVPAPSFPIHVYSVALASANVLSIDCTQPARFLTKVADVAENLYPRPKVLILNFPHNPSTTVVEPDFFVGVVALARKFGFMWSSTISPTATGGLTATGLRVFSAYREPRKSASKRPTSEQRLQHGGVAGGSPSPPGNAEMVRALATIKGYYDYGIFQAIQIAGILALRHGDEMVERQALEYQRRRDVLVEGLQRIGWEVTPPKASMFVWARYPRRVAPEGGFHGFRHEAPGQKQKVRRKPRARLRRGRRGLFAAGTGGERKTPQAGGAPDRAVLARRMIQCLWQKISKCHWQLAASG